MQYMLMSFSEAWPALHIVPCFLTLMDLIQRDCLGDHVLFESTYAQMPPVL